MSRRFCALVSLLLAAGCDSPSEPPPPPKCRLVMSGPVTSDTATTMTLVISIKVCDVRY